MSLNLKNRRSKMKKYQCTICGYIYDDAQESVKFEELPDDWTCPICGAPKSVFKEIKEEKPSEIKEIDEEEDLKEMSNSEIAYICSNLAKACEKQYLEEEQKLFTELYNHYLNKEKDLEGTLENVKEKVNKDLEEFDKAFQIADKYQDRGAKRVLTWASKATNMMNVIINNYKEKGIDYIKNTKIWVCDICGFIYIGDVPPTVCPICKVPSFKILEVK